MASDQITPASDDVFGRAYAELRQIARQQMERANRQVTESIQLQKQANDRAKQVARIAMPAIVLCIVLVFYLIVEYL